MQVRRTTRVTRAMLAVVAAGALWRIVAVPLPGLGWRNERRCGVQDALTDPVAHGLGHRHCTKDPTQHRERAPVGTVAERLTACAHRFW